MSTTSTTAAPPSSTHSPTRAPTRAPSPLSVPRLYAMRGGYLLMAIGLVLVKWPLLPSAHTLPLFEGVTLCLLTAMSLLAFVGVRHPVKLLPVLVFESVWKVLWLAIVALPRALDGGLDSEAQTVLVNCSVVVVILAVTPWGHVWRTWVRTPGDRWH